MSKLISLLLLTLTLVSPVQASEIATESGQVTATVPTAPVTDDNLPPTPPILLRPTDDSATADPHPEFVWTPSTDPDGNTILYDLYLNGVATYLGISNTGNSAGAGYTTTIVDNEIRLLPTSALSDGEYIWQIRAYDPTGDYNNSTTWDLTIDTTPPEFTITSIDIHHNLTLDSRNSTATPSDTSFEVTGPKDIYFTINTEPNTTIQLSFYDKDNNFITQTSDTTSFTNSTIHSYTHLEPGTYSVQAIAIDHVFLTSTLPTFELVVIQPTITFPVTPPISILIPPTISDLPSTLAHLPATIMRISTRVNIAVTIIIMIALALLLLLIFLKKRRYNLVIINSQGTPLEHATIYHSIPDLPAHAGVHPNHHHLHTPVLLTHRNPFRYPLTPSDHGRLYLPRFNRYSTLTIRTPDSLTILSISRYNPPLTLIIT